MYIPNKGKKWVKKYYIFFSPAQMSKKRAFDKALRRSWEMARLVGRTF